MESQRILLDSALGAAIAPKLDADAVWQPEESRAAEALSDLVAGFRRRWLWSALAYQDIRLRYRGSVLGPFWVTLSNLILVVLMGGIYGTLFHLETGEYVPFLICGLAIWSFISSMATDSCATFTAAQELIQQVPLPLSLQAYRVVYRNLIVLAHTAVLVPLGLLIFRVPVSWRLVEVLPAVVLLSIEGFWMSLFLGTISARFRDIPPIIGNIIYVVFFVTPVFWPIAAVGQWKGMLALNPFFATIDVIRAPLLGMAPEPTSWPVMIACTAIASLGGCAFFIRFRERIAYWI